MWPRIYHLESLVFGAFAFMVLTGGKKNFTLYWTVLGVWAEKLREATVILVMPVRLSTCSTVTVYGFSWNLTFRQSLIYLPTDAIVSCPKKNVIKIYIRTTPIWFGAVTQSSGSALFVLVKVTFVKIVH
jgi:hypothetical protein